MEKPRKIVLPVFAVLLYLLSASGFTGGTGHSILVEQGVESSVPAVFWAEELPLLSGFALKEGAGFHSGGNTAPGSVKQVQLYKAVMCAVEIEVACAFFQYVFDLQNNPVRIRKSDMLFPFHYFF